MIDCLLVHDTIKCDECVPVYITYNIQRRTKCTQHILIGIIYT